jgi:NADH:ubiquinone oxidoreductase subunit 3 (subunit A)
MKKPILISIIPSVIIAAPWLISSKELISFSETAAIILIGLTLIGLANIGRKKIKKN